MTKASILAPKSPSTFTPFASNSTDSFAQAFKGDSSSLRLDPNDLGAYHSEPESESIALGVINKPKEEEEDMSNDFRFDFKKRHRKRLYEVIDMVLPPTKRACLEGAREKPGREVPQMLVPSPDATEPNSVLAAEKEIGPTLGGAFSGAALIEEVLD